MNAKFGWNIDTSSIPFDRAVSLAKQSKADWHLRMITPYGFFMRDGDIDGIKHWLDAVPNTNVIVRVFHDNQGDWQHYPSAEEYETHWRYVANRLGANYLKRVVFDSPFNEPNLAGDDAASAKVFVDYNIALVEAAANAGIKLAVCAFSVGTPHESLLETEYLRLWRAVAKHRMGISWHLYGGIPLELGESMPFSAVLDATKARDYMQDKQWPITMQGWYIARAYRVIEIFRKYNLGTPEIYVTECLIDNIFNADNSQYKEAWRQKYGIDMFQRDPRGARAWERYLKEFYPDKNFSQALEAIFRHARKNIFYHPVFKALCIFALNVQWDYKYGQYGQDGAHKHSGSNFDRPEYEAFRAALPIINSESYSTPVPPPAPDPTPTPEPAIPMIAARIRSKAIEGTRLRQTPRNGAILGIIPNTWISAKIQADYAITAWPKLEALGLSGYAAKEWLEVEIEGMEKPTYNLSIDFAIDKATAERLLAELQRVLKP